METFSQIRKKLSQLSRAEIVSLAKRINESEHTLIKVWNGQTQNPGVLLVENIRRGLSKAVQ